MKTKSKFSKGYYSPNMESDRAPLNTFLFCKGGKMKGKVKGKIKIKKCGGKLKK